MDQMQAGKQMWSVRAVTEHLTHCRHFVLGSENESRERTTKTAADSATTVSHKVPLPTKEHSQVPQKERANSLWVEVKDEAEGVAGNLGWNYPEFLFTLH